MVVPQPKPKEVKVIYNVVDIPKAPIPEALRKRKHSRQIIHRICKLHGIDVHELLNGSKRNAVILARREICYILARDTDLSLAAVGRMINRDHTTVMHAIAVYCGDHCLPYPREKKAGYRRKSVRRKELVGDTEEHTLCPALPEGQSVEG